MIVFIPTGKSYTATMVGTIAKPVSCEHCRTEFVYLIKRRAVGRGVSPLFIDADGAASHARRSAQNQLQTRLAHGIELVACPQCGRFQSYMIGQARQKRFIALGAIASVSLIFYIGIWQLCMPPFGNLTMVPWGIPGLIALTLLLAGLLIWMLRHDMNARAESRKGVVRRNVMLRSQFEALMTSTHHQQPGHAERP